MSHYLRQLFGVWRRRLRKPIAPRHAAVPSNDRWCTPDGVEIWRAMALYQPCVEVLEGAQPMRVVLLADYEALAGVMAATLKILKTAQKLPLLSDAIA